MYLIDMFSYQILRYTKSVMITHLFIVSASEVATKHLFCFSFHRPHKLTINNLHMSDYLL